MPEPMSFEERVLNVLIRKGYPYTNETHIEAIVATWGALEEFDPDPSDEAIVFAYEALGMYDYITGKEV
jgi:hypothetical protein